jgi:hypothetical protein
MASVTSLAGVSQTALSVLGPIVVGIGLALGALLPSAVAGLGGLAGMATVAAAAVGVLALAFSGVSDAYKLMERRSLETDLAGGRSTKSASGVASAQRSLANVRQNAADQAVDAAERVMRADEDLRETSVDAARAIETAQQRAAKAVSDALRSQEDADRSLVRALRDEDDAMVALNRTRENALRVIEDLDMKVRENTLNQRQAVLDLADAEEELFWTQINRRSTGEQLERADIAYLRQQMRVEELRREAEELGKSQTEAAKAGVEGAEDVVAAQRRLEDAHQAVEDAQRDAADAAKDVDQARVEGARDVAEAQEDASRRIRDALRTVDDALRAQERQARQSAFAIEQALAAVTGASESAGGSGSGALARINEELERVNPAVRTFAEYLYDRVKPAFDDLQGIAAEGVLPGLQTGIESFLSGPLLPKVQSLVGTIAESLGGMFERAGERLNSPFWLSFFDDLEANAVPVLEDMETIVWNLAEGFAGIVQAFLDDGEEGASVAQDLSGGLVDITNDFAEWGRTLKDNPEFKEFIQDVKDAWPEIVQGAKDFGEALKSIWEFFEEHGDTIMAVVGGIADIFEDIADIFDPEQWEEDFTEAGHTIQRWWQGIEDWWNGIDFGAMGSAILDGIVEGLKDAVGWDQAVEQWNKLVDGFKDFFGISSPSTLFVSLAGDLIDGLLEGLSTGATTVLTWFSELPTKITNALSSLGSTLGNVATSAFQWFKDTAIRKGDELVNWLTGLPGKAANAIGNLGSLLYDKGRDLIQGMVNGISQAAGFVGDVAKTVVNSIIRFINSEAIDRINRLLEFKIAGVTINPPDIPRIPLLAAGAVIERPTLAVVGEAGREVVLPLGPGMGARRSQLMSEAGLGGSVSIDARQFYTVADTQTAEEVGAVVGQRIVRDIRTGVESRYGAGVLIP